MDPKVYGGQSLNWNDVKELKISTETYWGIKREENPVDFNTFSIMLGFLKDHADKYTLNLDKKTGEVSLKKRPWYSFLDTKVWHARRLQGIFNEVAASGTGTSAGSPPQKIKSYEGYIQGLLEKNLVQKYRQSLKEHKVFKFSKEDKDLLNYLIRNYNQEKDKLDENEIKDIKCLESIYNQEKELVQKEQKEIIDKEIDHLCFASNELKLILINLKQEFHEGQQSDSKFLVPILRTAKAGYLRFCQNNSGNVSTRMFAGTLLRKDHNVYLVMGEIGKGAFGRALEVQELGLNNLLALKEPIPKGKELDANISNDLRNEFEITKRLNGAPGVMKPLHKVTYKGKECLMGPKYDTDCWKLRFEGPVTVTEIKSLVIQILSGVESMHKKNIFHGDIKPANIFANRAVPGVREAEFFIGDFGGARVMEKNADQAPQQYTKVYSPKHFKKELIGLARAEYNDIFATGVVLYEMYTGSYLPFRLGEDKHPIDNYQALSQKTHPYIPEHICNLINSMLDPTKQHPTAANALKIMNS